MAVDWVQDLQPWQLSSKLLLNYTAHEWLSQTSAVNAAELDWLFMRDEVFGDVICCWICWSMHFDQAPVKITVYGCVDLCYSGRNFCWRQLIFRWLWEVFTTKFLTTLKHGSAVASKTWYFVVQLTDVSKWFVNTEVRLLSAVLSWQCLLLAVQGPHAWRANSPPYHVHLLNGDNTKKSECVKCKQGYPASLVMFKAAWMWCKHGGSDAAITECSFLSQ